MALVLRNIARHHFTKRGFKGLFVGLSLVIFIGVFIRLTYEWSEFLSLRGKKQKAFKASIFVAVANFLS